MLQTGKEQPITAPTAAQRWTEVLAMDVREKLIEILRKPIFPHELVDPTEAVADYLLDNGVTVQEWISVKDRLPEAGEYVVCIAKRNPFSMFMPMVVRIKKNGWVNPITEQYISEVTHWMQMPHPPKEDGYHE